MSGVFPNGDSSARRSEAAFRQQGRWWAQHRQKRLLVLLRLLRLLLLLLRHQTTKAFTQWSEIPDESGLVSKCFRIGGVVCDLRTSVGVRSLSGISYRNVFRSPKDRPISRSVSRRKEAEENQNSNALSGSGGWEKKISR